MQSVANSRYNVLPNCDRLDEIALHMYKYVRREQFYQLFTF